MLNALLREESIRQRRKPIKTTTTQNSYMKSFLRKAMIGTAGLVLFTSTAKAAWVFANADIVIGFQASAGTGTATNLFYNLGDSFTFRTEADPYGFVGNINDDLTAAYGSDWATRGQVHFGAFGNRSNLSATSDPGDIANGIEPGRTVYVSVPTINLGTATLKPSIASGALATPTSQYAGLRTMLDANPVFVETAFGDGVTSLNQTANPVEWANSWTARVPVSGQAFGNLGGIQQTFGAGSVAIIDIQRMRPSTTTDYVGSVMIYDNGDIYAIPEPSTSLLGAVAAGVLAFRRRRKA
jgi:hypothetical protein